MEANKYILLTIDVEDWFQVENFKPWIPFSTWDQRELRVEKNVHQLLDLLESCEVAGKQACWEAGRLGSKKAGKHEARSRKADIRKEMVEGTAWKLEEPDKKSRRSSKSCLKESTKNGIKSTFFILGWIAEKLPHLIREIQSRGHEIASHGYNHGLCNQLSSSELRQDLTDSKKRLEDLTGSPVFGYRAPSFAINDDILKIIEDCGYLYDSSYNSFGLHGRYGQISLNGTGKKGVAHKLSDNFYELPISNLHFSTLGTLAHFRHFRHFHLPWGGGAYFRLLPVPIFNLGVKKILRQQDAYVFYAHPWEIDPGQPRVQGASANFKFRHYTNLRKTTSKLSKLIKQFDQCKLITCSQYLVSQLPGFPAS